MHMMMHVGMREECPRCKNRSCSFCAKQNDLNKSTQSAMSAGSIASRWMDGWMDTDRSGELQIACHYILLHAMGTRIEIL